MAPRVAAKRPARRARCGAKPGDKWSCLAAGGALAGPWGRRRRRPLAARRLGRLRAAPERLADGQPAVAPEGPRRDLEPGRRLPALVLVAVDHAHHLAD